MWKFYRYGTTNDFKYYISKNLLLYRPVLYNYFVIYNIKFKSPITLIGKNDVIIRYAIN